MVGREAVGPPPKVELALLERHEARRWEESRPGQEKETSKKLTSVNYIPENSSVAY
jgi:hypothetical protein